MRRLEEILRTYNIVNSRAVSRYTIRFAAAFALVAVAFVAVAMLLTGGPDGETVPRDLAARNGNGTGDGGEAPAQDPLAIQTVESGDTVYIGYPPGSYDPARADAYDAVAVQEALVEWLRSHRGVTADAPQEVEAPDGRLIGYLLQIGPALE